MADNIHFIHNVSDPTQRIAFPQDKKFHRIMEFGERGLQGVVKEKALTFVSYDRWADTHEAYFIQALRTAEGINLLDKAFKKFGYKHHARLFAIMMQDLKRARHMQSWTCGPETREMWGIYSKDRKGVRVQTSALKVWNARIEALPIQYIPDLSVEAEVKRLFSNDGLRMDLIDVFTQKLDQFDFEMEVRFISEDVTMMDQDKSGVVRSDPSLRKVDISHIPDFIESVVVDPEAKDEFVDDVRKFCFANGVPFDGKSALNEFILK
jgi:hypothetical protein